MDLQQKDLESLSVAIFQHESSLRWDQPEETNTSDDGSSDHGVENTEEAEMAITPVADDTPPVSAHDSFLRSPSSQRTNPSHGGG